MPADTIKKDIILSPRLEMLLELAGEGRCICDVGCDHGFLSIGAVLRGKFMRAIATDINEGPIASAQKNSALYGVCDALEFRRSDGLSAVMPGEADVILIAGMGGALMQSIISCGMATAAGAHRLILSPQSDIGDFRRFILGSGFEITDEEAIEDDGKYYFAMSACFSEGGASHPRGDAGNFSGDAAIYPHGDAGIAFGGLLLEKRHPVLREYLLRQKKVKQDILRGLPKGSSVRAAELEEELGLIGEALYIYEG